MGRLAPKAAVPAGSEPKILRKDTEHPVEPGRSRRGTTHLCSRWFLALYSDYRDGMLDENARAEMIAHMAGCASCRRYDRVIRRGVAVLRDSLREDPDALVDRDQTPEDYWTRERGGYSRPAITSLTAAATLLLIALNIVSGWTARLGRGSPGLEGPPVAAAPFRPEAPLHFPLPPLLHLPHVGSGPDEADHDMLFELPRMVVRTPASAPAVAPVDPD